ncbi:MAG: cell division protein FtsI/penicillin-binding protein 2 [Chlamydiales bacterium]
MSSMGTHLFTGTTTRSASGLRPASAFVFIGMVLLAATAKAVHIAFCAEGAQPDRFRTDTAPGTSFDIVDRKGVPLAVSVECFELSLSPQAMWRSHTPRYMADRIAGVLGDADSDELMARMLSIPGDEDGSGLLVVRAPRALWLSREAAERVRSWIASGPFEGFWITRLPRQEAWTLAWNPELALSKAQRLVHQPDNEHRPERWTKSLLDGLVDAVGEETLCALDPERFASLGRRDLRAALRDSVWDELMPTCFRRLRSNIEPVIAHSLTRMLKDEAVSPLQMCLEDRLVRRYPVRTASAAGDPGPASSAFTVLGSWGVLGKDAAAKEARRALDLESEARDWSPESRRAFVDQQSRELQSQRRPRTGLELLAKQQLNEAHWAGILSSGGRVYGRRVRHLPRDCRRGWDGRVPDYYDSALDAPEHPRVYTSIDADLQRFIHTTLEETLEEQAAAIAMGVAVDVQTGAVLGVDGVCAYETSGFAPIRHAFTPGSTLKAVIMAMALDGGFVEPEELFDTYLGRGLLVRGKTRGKRWIHEALGAPKEPWVSATVGLARSVNAVLVQIGLRMPADLIHDRLSRLGYGTRPGAGLGPEAAGSLPSLDDGDWSRCYTHASVSFGHEISVSLWQHAAALATIARGGVFRPLRLIEGIEQDGQRWDLPLPEEGTERVFSERACQSVRDMMAGGAKWGTGRNVASPEVCPEFTYLGTKTGTTEKAPNERCLHVELAHHVEHARTQSDCSSECLAGLVGQRVHSASRTTCYTSSMCAVGRIADGREVMVVVVVDDPGGRAKYGSEVAGPTAIRILRRAAGLREGPERTQPLAHVTAEAFNVHDTPWAGGDL